MRWDGCKKLPYSEWVKDYEPDTIFCVERSLYVGALEFYAAMTSATMVTHQIAGLVTACTWAVLPYCLARAAESFERINLKLEEDAVKKKALKDAELRRRAIMEKKDA